jgi:DedD protein
MRDYEEKSYYEIQLDNKQLILVFLAAVTVCVLIFVLGVMIGKGQKEAEYAAGARDEKKLAAAEPDTNVPQQALSDIASESRTEEEPVPAEPIAEPVVEKKPSKPEPEKKTPAKEKPEAKPKEKSEEKYAFEDLDKTEQEPVEKKTVQTAKDTSVEEELADSGKSRYTVQVMATSSKPKAEEQISRLRSKGYKPFLDESRSGQASVFKVRVGRFSDTDEAKKMASKIKSDFKLETWVAVLD